QAAVIGGTCGRLEAGIPDRRALGVTGARRVEAPGRVAGPALAAVGRVGAAWQADRRSADAGGASVAGAARARVGAGFARLQAKGLVVADRGADRAEGALDARAARGAAVAAHESFGLGQTDRVAV